MGPPVPRDLAREFLQAVYAEYVRGEAEAVGELFDRRNESSQAQALLDLFEDKIRASSDREAAINSLAALWGFPSSALRPSPQSSPQSSPESSPHGSPLMAPQLEPHMQATRRPARRRAVLIGINYFGTRAELRGCINDVHNLRSLLVETFGWEPSCIRTLTDDSPSSMPTRHNIECALRWLVEDVQPTDAFFLHFSGHGAQEEDPNGFEEDGMHETICPVDFQEAGMITDDHLNELVIRMLPQGARLTAVMDCCHSGTGLDLPWMHMGQGWREETNPFHTVGDVQMFSGCEDHDTSADACEPGGAAGGAMTTAFCDVLRRDPCPVYPQLMAQLRSVMCQRGFSQRPQLTSSQAFTFDRPFHLDDAIPNSNRQLGRIFRKRFPPKPRPMSGPFAEMLGMGAAVAGGVVVGAMAMQAADAFGGWLF